MSHGDGSLFHSLRQKRDEGSAQSCASPVPYWPRSVEKRPVPLPGDTVTEIRNGATELAANVAPNRGVRQREDRCDQCANRFAGDALTTVANMKSPASMIGTPPMNVTLTAAIAERPMPSWYLR